MKSPPKINKKIVVALSGGVDSSVSAALLKEQGYDVVGVFMKVWAKPTTNNPHSIANCPWVEDQFEARRAAEHLGIPFYTINLEKEYQEAVVDYFFREYASGRTPNPDVLCNSEIKFGVFLKRMLELGADYVVTGHYSRLAISANQKISNIKARNSKQIRNSKGQNSKSFEHLDFENLGIVSDFARLPVSQGFRNSDLQKLDIKLLRGVDPKKDQSYFLWRLTQHQLKYVLFPVGGYAKTQVRELARKFGLPNANRKDSQGICFIGPVDIQDFLKTQLPVKKGKVLTTDGQIVGEHDGAWFYTIGQRHGWTPSSPQSTVHRPPSKTVNRRPSTVDQKNRPALYVVDKDLKNNILVVGPDDDPKLWAKGMIVSQVNWMDDGRWTINDGRLAKSQVQIRYQQKPTDCTIQNLSNHQLEVIFKEPVRAVTPGQSAVFYDGDVMLGGGVIEQGIF